ncbi:MAG: P-loop NTPase, partial [Gammaproteobacteria bacterium]|nr:P-loop NTPase [Gammaproteobacteria bacterium]
SQPKLFSIEQQRPVSEDGSIIEPLCEYDVRLMSIGLLVDTKQAMVWRGPMATQALNQLLQQTHWGELDVLLVDMPPGTGDIQLTMAQRVALNGAIIVTTPQEMALVDARRGIEMFQKVNIPILGVVENMSYFECSSCETKHDIFGSGGGVALAEQYSLPLLAQLPLLANVQQLSDAGEPITVREPKSEIAQQFQQSATTLMSSLKASINRPVGPEIAISND